MPIPTPRKKETEQEFVSRCMGDDVMVHEYPDLPQRAVICYNSWKEHGHPKESP